MWLFFPCYILLPGWKASLHEWSIVGRTKSISAWSWDLILLCVHISASKSDVGSRSSGRKPPGPRIGVRSQNWFLTHSKIIYTVLFCNFTHLSMICPMMFFWIWHLPSRFRPHPPLPPWCPVPPALAHNFQIQKRRLGVNFIVVDNGLITQMTSRHVKWGRWEDNATTQMRISPHLGWGGR